MDPNETTGVSTYFQSQQQPPTPLPLNPTATAATDTAIATATATATATDTATDTATATAATNANALPTNGIFPNAATPTGGVTTTASSPMVYSQNVPPAMSSGLETVKRKRGRPRKYGTPEQVAAAKRLAASSSPISTHKKKDHAFGGRAAAGGSACASSSSKKYQLPAVGNTGQAFTAHVINVAAGEDVGQKIMTFVQQSKRELCILSASGMISNASLRQPDISGGSISYEGRFDILSLSGSYVRNELGGRAGGLSVCLASSDGQIIGGGVGGPLTAAGPIQVIVGTFVIDTKKDMSGGVKGDTSASKLPSPLGGASISGVSFWSTIDSSHQNIGGNEFMIDSQGMHLAPPSQSMEWRGDNPGHDVQQSPENGNY